MKVRKQHQLQISNQFAASENLHDNEDIKRALENITDNMKIFTKKEPGSVVISAA
jgi:hypothetical protein